MKYLNAIGFIILFLVNLDASSQQQSIAEFPKPVGWTNDFERIFTKTQTKELDSIISEHEKITSNQIVIVTLDTVFTSEEELFNYSLKLFQHWGVGTKEKNNGIGILFGKKMRMIRIQSGYGIESKISNEETKKIIDEVIIPEFKQEKYFEGIKKGLLALIEKIK